MGFRFRVSRWKDHNGRESLKFLGIPLTINYTLRWLPLIFICRYALNVKRVKLNKIFCYFCLQ